MYIKTLTIQGFKSCQYNSFSGGVFVLIYIQSCKTATRPKLNRFLRDTMW